MELARSAKAIMRASKTLPEASHKAREMESHAEKLMTEADALRIVARLEDLSVWMIKKTKTTKKGKTTYVYWMASWRGGDKVRNVHLGSCSKVNREASVQKARVMKAEA